MSEHALDPKPTRISRWLARRRLQFAIGIALAEGLLVLLTKDWSKWTVIIIAVPVILFYVFAGRALEWETGRQLSSIAGASQALAVIVVIFAVVVKWLLVAGIIALAVFALIFLMADRPKRSAPSERP